MKLTIDWLEKQNGCKEGIKFVKNNNLEGYDLDYLSEIEGDYDRFIFWLKNKVENCTYDQNNNILTYKDSNGFSREYTYDENNNRLTMKDSSGYSYKYTYDKNNNLLTSKNSKGYSKEYTYDQNNNILTSKDSNRFSIKYTYDKNNNKLTYKDSNGFSRKYTYTKTKDYFIITKNGKQTLKIPLKYIN